jgi:hypothetical protein
MAGDESLAGRDVTFAAMSRRRGGDRLGPKAIEMAIKMTNRLLAVVIAFALSSGIFAHAAQDPNKPFGPITLPAATSLPATLQTAASHITETATSAIDPSGAIRDAYQRDHVALEGLRQEASQLQGNAHPDFNQYISDQESALVGIERLGLATTRPNAQSTIAAMDQLVAATQAELSRELAQAGAQKTNSSTSAGKSHPTN